MVICYNGGGKGHSMKSCISATWAVSKKSERTAGPVDKGKKRVKIIDDEGFTKVVKTQSTASRTSGPVPKTPILAPRIVELVSD